MSLIRLVIFLFVLGSLVVLPIVLVHSLPFLPGPHQLVIALLAGLVILANGIVLYLYIYKFNYLKKDLEHQEFICCLNETSSCDEPSLSDFMAAYELWKEGKNEQTID